MQTLLFLIAPKDMEVTEKKQHTVYQSRTTSFRSLFMYPTDFF